ncbi:MAG: cold shock domain-containing protein [Hydrogenophilales bacterium]|nr:cold shock domain-containing protein [Hydrogenophilales bacterium]
MANGVVKWFNNTKGYGFIAPEEGEDLFVHYSSIQVEGYRTLKGGQRVAFEIQNGEKGAHAINVSPAADSPPN